MTYLLFNFADNIPRFYFEAVRDTNLHLLKGLSPPIVLEIASVLFIRV